jgi:hypothetical protein
MFDSILDVAPEYFDKAIHFDNLTFWLIAGFWILMFIIALNETSKKNRRGK